MNVDQLEDHIREKYKDVLETFQNGSPQFDLINTTVEEAFELKLVVIKKSEQGKGFGGRILNEILDYADRNNLIIVLSPSEIKTAKLIKWYKSFDFLENKNRNKDFRFMNRMIRYPKGMTRSKWIDSTQAVGTHVIRSSELPEDMKILLEDFIEGELPESFEIKELNPLKLPPVDLSKSDRGEEHALDMDITNTPPLVVAHGFLLDGQHRLWKLQREEINSAPYIDISKFVRPEYARSIQILSLASLTETTADTIKWTVPKWEDEAEEFTRYPQLSKQDYDKASESGLTSLTKEMWEKLDNSDSYDLTSIEEAYEKATEYNRDIDRIFDGIAKGETIPAPIIMKKPNGRYELIGGNTRLMAMRILILEGDKLETPKVLLIDKSVAKAGSRGAHKLNLKQCLDIKENQYRTKDARYDYQPEEIEERILELQGNKDERHLKLLEKQAEEWPDDVPFPAAASVSIHQDLFDAAKDAADAYGFDDKEMAFWQCNLFSQAVARVARFLGYSDIEPMIMDAKWQTDSGDVEAGQVFNHVCLKWGNKYVDFTIKQIDEHEEFPMVVSELPDYLMRAKPLAIESNHGDEVYVESILENMGLLSDEAMEEVGVAMKVEAALVPGTEVIKYLEKTSGDIIWGDFGIEGMNFELRKVKLSEIQDVVMQGKDEEICYEYTQRYLNTGSHFPPVVLAGRIPYQIIDGFHRVYAARDTELDSIDAYVPVRSSVSASLADDAFDAYHAFHYSSDNSAVDDFEKDFITVVSKLPTKQVPWKDLYVIHLDNLETTDIDKKFIEEKFGTHKKFIEEAMKTPSIVLEDEGKKFVLDGQHRISQHIKNGTSAVPAVIVKLTDFKGGREKPELFRESIDSLAYKPIKSLLRAVATASSEAHELKFKLTTIPGQRKAMEDLLEDLSDKGKVEIGRVRKSNGDVGESILEAHIMWAEPNAYSEIMKYLSLYREMGDKFEMEFDKKIDQKVAASTRFDKALQKIQQGYQTGVYTGYLDPIKYESELREELEKIAGKPIYRAVQLDHENQLDPKSVGIYWTWDKDKAVTYWGHDGLMTVTLESEAKEDIVDWEATIEQWMKPQYNGECEVRLKPKSPVEITNIWVNKIKKDKKFKAVALTDTTAKDAADMLSLRCDCDGDHESFEKIVNKATAKEFSPKELNKILRLHGETFFNHSDREPVSEDEALDILHGTDCPHVILKNGKYYALDGQHRINTAIVCSSPLDIKIVDGKNLEFNTFGYEIPELTEKV